MGMDDASMRMLSAAGGPIGIESMTVLSFFENVTGSMDCMDQVFVEGPVNFFP